MCSAPRVGLAIFIDRPLGGASPKPPRTFLAPWARDQRQRDVTARTSFGQWISLSFRVSISVARRQTACAKDPCLIPNRARIRALDVSEERALRWSEAEKRLRSQYPCGFDGTQRTRRLLASPRFGPSIQWSQRAQQCASRRSHTIAVLATVLQDPRFA
jgi:hypothetical protein